MLGNNAGSGPWREALATVACVPNLRADVSWAPIPDRSSSCKPSSRQRNQAFWDESLVGAHPDLGSGRQKIVTRQEHSPYLGVPLPKARTTTPDRAIGWMASSSMTCQGLAPKTHLLSGWERKQQLQAPRARARNRRCCQA